MYKWLQALKIILSLLCLSYASWQDYRFREVPNKIWVIFAPFGLTLNVLDIFYSQDFFLLINLATSVFVVSGLSICLFYLGFFGGADAKALICLSMTLPNAPVLFRFKVIPNLFSLSVFDNAILISALLAFFLAIYNVIWHVNKEESLFEGLEHESVWKKFLALITGYKVEFSKIKESHLSPLEEVVRLGDGRLLRRLKIFIKVEEKPKRAQIERLSVEPDEKIWVTPDLPFIIFITLGLVVNFVIGDLILLVTSSFILL